MKQENQSRDQEFLAELTFEPVTRENRRKYMQFSGEWGPCGNCWCMWPRRTKRDFDEGKSDDGNKMAMKELVWSGKLPASSGCMMVSPLYGAPLHPGRIFLSLRNQGFINGLTTKRSGRFPAFSLTKISGDWVFLSRC